MKDWIRKHCADDEEGAACYQWLEQVVAHAEIPIHARVKEKALGEWGPTITVGVPPKLGTFQLMQPVSLTYADFWRLPEASVRAQRDAARAREAVQLLSARVPVIGYADIPRAQRPTFGIRQAQEQKAVGLLGDQEAAVSNLPNSFRLEAQRAPRGQGGRGARGGRGAGRGGRGGRGGGVPQSRQVAQANPSDAVSIEELNDEWAVGTFRVMYTGQGTPWQLARIERRPATVDPKDRVSIMWYDRNIDSTTRFTRTPIKAKGGHGTDLVYVMSFGPTVMAYMNGRAQDYIDITNDELARITEAVQDWDEYEESEPSDASEASNE